MAHTERITTCSWRTSEMTQSPNRRTRAFLTSPSWSAAVRGDDLGKRDNRPTVFRRGEQPPGTGMLPRPEASRASTRRSSSLAEGKTIKPSEDLLARGGQKNSSKESTPLDPPSAGRSAFARRRARDASADQVRDREVVEDPAQTDRRVEDRRDLFHWMSSGSDPYTRLASSRPYVSANSRTRSSASLAFG